VVQFVFPFFSSVFVLIFLYDADLSVDAMWFLVVIALVILVAMFWLWLPR
jgi:hypothetical protein